MSGAVVAAAGRVVPGLSQTRTKLWGPNAALVKEKPGGEEKGGKWVYGVLLVAGTRRRAGKGLQDGEGSAKELERAVAEEWRTRSVESHCTYCCLLLLV